MSKYSFAYLPLVAFSAIAQTTSLPSTPEAPPAPLAFRTPAARPNQRSLGDGIAEFGGPPRIVEIPLLDCSGLPCIDMTSGSGKTLRLLIDTAERNSYLDSKVAQSLGVELQSLTGGADSRASEVQQTILPGARVGDLAMGDFPFMVLDTAPEAGKSGSKAQPLPGDGVLAFSAFKNRLVQLDYAQRLVRISEPQQTAQPCPHNCGDLVIKHFGRFGPITLTTAGFSVNGQSVDVQLDTLFTGTMLVYPASVEKLGLKREAKAKHKEVFPFIQGGLKLARADAATESYGGVALMRDAPLYFLTSEELPPSLQFDATVGSGLLSQGVVTFDFRGMHMWMEPPTLGAAARRAQREH